jgi:hypothetical protein
MRRPVKTEVVVDDEESQQHISGNLLSPAAGQSAPEAVLTCCEGQRCQHLVGIKRPLQQLLANLEPSAAMQTMTRLRTGHTDRPMLHQQLYVHCMMTARSQLTVVAGIQLVYSIGLSV